MFTNKNDLAGAILGPAAVVFCLSCFCHMSEKIKRSPRVPQLSTRSKTFRHRLGLCKEPTLTGCTLGSRAHLGPGVFHPSEIEEGVKACLTIPVVIFSVFQLDLTQTDDQTRSDGVVEPG